MAALQKAELTEAFYLLLIPEYLNDQIDYFRVGLLNFMEEDLAYRITLKLDGEIVHKGKGTLEVDTFKEEAEMGFEELNDQPRFEVYYQLKEHADHGEKVVKPKAKQIFAGPKLVDELKEAAFVYEVFRQPEAKPVKKPEHIEGLPPTPNVDVEKLRESMLGGSGEPPKESMLLSSKGVDVIDLHMEQLLPDAGDMSNGEMLDFQLTALDRCLEACLAAGNHHQLLIIHGKGKGRLREAVHDYLNQHPGVTRYELTISLPYGAGATMAYF